MLVRTEDDTTLEGYKRVCKGDLQTTELSTVVYLKDLSRLGSIVIHII